MGEKSKIFVLNTVITTCVIIICFADQLDWTVRSLSTSGARLKIMKTRNMYQCERLCLRYQLCVSVIYSTKYRSCTMYTEEFTNSDITQSRQHIIANIHNSSGQTEVCTSACPLYSICVPRSSDSTCLVIPLARDCQEVLEEDSTATDGVYIIRPEGSGLLKVYCDMTDNGGGWTVFQRRTDGSELFYRDWNSYRDGFGDVRKEFWLGNENIFHLTNQKNYSLKVDLEDFEHNLTYASYSSFRIQDETDMFRLRISGYTGEAGDSLGRHNNYAFSTWDADNDIHDTLNCAEQFIGAWWYFKCHISNLNGQYNNTNYAKGIIWYSFRQHFYSLKSSVMKIRP